MNTNPLTEYLTQLPIGMVRYFPSIGSTNDNAIAWINESAPDFSVVVADEQTSGRGRLDRKWITHHGSSLAFSVILRLKPEEVQYTPLISPLAGVAVVAAIEHLYHLPAMIKWPNDVLIHDRKICGILAESIWEADSLAGVVVGIGINITPESIPPAEVLNFPASFLENYTTSGVSRPALLAEVVKQLIHWRLLLPFDDFFHFWNNHLAFVGKEVVISGTLSNPIYGVMAGVDCKGELILDTPDGEQTVQVGDVHLRLRDE